MIDRRDFLVGVALIAGGMSSLAASVRGKSADMRSVDIATGLPSRIGSWHMGEADDLILPPDDDYSRKVYDQIVARRYFSDQHDAVTLLIAYGPGQSYSTQMHRPEVCYPSSGFRITSRTDADVGIGDRLLPAGYLEAARGERSDSVLYWTRMGQSYPRSLWDQRRLIAAAPFASEPVDGVLVRLSTTSQGRDPGRGDLVEFAKMFHASLTAKYRALLFGSLQVTGVTVQGRDGPASAV